MFESLGWLNLNNTARAISMKGSRLEFVGVNDAHVGWDRLSSIPGAMDDMRENVGWRDEPGPDPVTIGLTHAPYQRVLNSFVNYGAEVIFAGHTHGGQVQVPGFGALVTNCDLPRSQASGLSPVAPRPRDRLPERVCGARHVDFRPGALRLPARSGTGDIHGQRIRLFLIRLRTNR